MYLITLFRVLYHHQRCLQANVENRNEPKHVMPKSKDLSRSLDNAVSGYEAAPIRVSSPLGYLTEVFIFGILSDENKTII